MPRRGRHRTRLPFRLLAAVAALLVGGTAVVLGGSALAKDEGGDSGGGGSFLSSLTGSSSSDSDDSGSDDSDSGDSDDSDSKDSGSDGSDDSKDSGEDKSGDDKSGGDQSGEDKSGDQGQGGDEGKDQSPDESKKTDDQKKDDQDKEAKGEKKVEFPGRDKIAEAGADRYVDIENVDVNGNIGEGGSFSKGSYSVDCGVSDHNNSDNYMAAPGKRNGAQHVHDYVGNTSTNGNSNDESLDAAGTSCKNGDKSTFFWPVLRDLNGTDDDANADGGGKDGNVGRKLTPQSAQLTFRGHGDQEVQPMPQHLMNIMGNAKAKAQDGKNANAKYTCTGFTDRVTDKYPICPSGSKLVRILDYPSCWDGQNLESKDLRSHMAFPDSSGNCQDDFKSVPALRITLTYDQPAGRAFAIDSFPDNQHDPTTDHSDFENFATKAQNDAGAECINANKTCINVGA
ncbi:DUF1996 domain-containing protein [Actinomycetospora termitidis]|uniref:DUF1996 domain-containing protein n=1 Tax=Actinomycetospora termitidis TaxID=3053470 RepID=A0ABT7M266_9PSEU|nr:DUF1996 domain-containing protein [Actinomycetospora sp. Odt1-22]MDL5154749.1 DUF1996 domain-containing protein [Actinomycetospora sp. Odt1-22]